MSELQQAKKELIDVLDRIPVSGSFEGAELAQRASSLVDKIRELKAQEFQFTTLASKPPTSPKAFEGQ